MASSDFQGLVLNGVTKPDQKELGRGAYGRVYAVKYGTPFVSKLV